MGKEALLGVVFQRDFQVFRPAFFLINRSQSIQRVDIVWPEDQRPLVIFFCAVQFPSFLITETPIIVRLEVIRVDFQSRAIILKGFLIGFDFPIREPSVMVKIRFGWV
jgi:hypothetical protein